MSDVLTPECRVIDLGARDAQVLRDLRDLGVKRYLALTDHSDLDSLREAVPDAENRFQLLEGSGQAFRCSADVLILRHSHFTAMWRVRALKHLRYIAVENSRERRTEQRVVRTYAGRTGVVSSRGSVSLGNSSFELFEVMRRAKPVTRRYLPPILGVSGLGSELHKEGVHYAILRWYDNLPKLEPGEDLDILVADDDLARFHSLIDQEPGTIPMDVYSESGLPGSDFLNMAYYPPELAREMLRDVVKHKSGLSILSPRHHLLALAYHAAYHKGPRSGIPSALVAPVADPEHDYAKALVELGEENGVEVTTTLEGLDALLTAQGWSPGLDTKYRLAEWNPWLASQMPAVDAGSGQRAPELAVFLVRDRLEEILTEREIRAHLAHAGFDVLVTRRLDATAQARTSSHTRGGNWGRGPFPTSGGLPVVAIVAVHHAPKPPRRGVRDRYPRLTNGDCLEVKEDFRALVATRVDVQDQFNPIHSSDNEEEAWEYVSLAMPDSVDELRETVERRRAEYRPQVPVVRELSRGRRARVDVVRSDAGIVVRKTYARGFLAHMAREINAREMLDSLSRFVPPLLETGELWFDCPLYDDRLNHDLRPGQLLPLQVVRGMIDVLRMVDALGYDLVDAKPGNFILDSREGLKVMDLEFLYPKSDPERPFSASYAFHGVPETFAGDRPFGVWTYRRRWLRPTGLSLDLLTSGSLPRQHVYRTAYRGWSLTAAARRGSSRSAVRGRKALQKAGSPVVGKLKRWMAARAISVG